MQIKLINAEVEVVPIQYEMVCTEVRSTVLQGSCFCLVSRGSAGRSSLRCPGSPLVVLRPFLPLTFVSPPFSFDGRLLLLVVLAGLLPQVATIVIRLTEPSLTFIALQKYVSYALFPNFHQVFSLGRALPCRYYH